MHNAFILLSFFWMQHFTIQIPWNSNLDSNANLACMSLFIYSWSSCRWRCFHIDIITFLGIRDLFTGYLMSFKEEFPFLQNWISIRTKAIVLQDKQCRPFSFFKNLVKKYLIFLGRGVVWLIVSSVQSYK